MQDMLQKPMNLYVLVQIMWQRAWWVVACLVFTVGLGAAYLLSTEPVYRVHARILVEQKGLSPSQEPPERDEDFLATQAEIIRSPAVVGRAVERLGLRAATGDERDPVVTVLKSLSVNPLLGTNVLSVSLHSPDARQAKRTVETVIESYEEYVRDSERGEHLDTLRTLTASEKQVRSDLRDLEAEYAELRRESPLVGQDEDRARVQRDLLTHLGQLLADAKSRRMELENRMAALQGLRQRNLARDDESRAASPNSPHFVKTNSGSTGPLESAPMPLLVRSSQNALLHYAEGEERGAISHLQQQLAEAQTQEKEFAEKYGPKHVKLRTVREQIAHWRSLLRGRTESAPLVLQQELEATQKHEDQLAALYEEEFEKAKDVDNFLLKEQQAMAHIKRTQEIHESILDQVRQWQLVDQALAQGEAGVGVRVLEEPSDAAQQVWPPKLLVLGACALVGLMGGMGLVITVGNPGAAVLGSGAELAALPLPVLARVPAVSQQQGDAAAPARLALDQPESAAAEAFRRLGTRLAGSPSERGAAGSSICITGVASGAGATTATANLSLSLVLQGKKVAVVDADLRNGDLAERLGAGDAFGLDAVLRGQVALEDALRRSPLAPVDVLGGGRQAPATDEAPAPDPADFAKLLESLRSQYDLVLVDAPAVGLSGDAFAVPGCADGVLLVVSGERSASEAVERTCHRLREAGAPLLGVVLNRVDASVDSPGPVVLSA